MQATIEFATRGTATFHGMPDSAEFRRDCGASAKLWLAGRLPRKANLLCALVVSSDEKVQQDLADIVTRCGLIPFRAFTVGESRRILARQEIGLVVSDDRLIDGTYEDLLAAAKVTRTAPLVIVVSMTGDWPDYFRATSGGAFDFLAYPPIRGELARVIHHALEARNSRSCDDCRGRSIVTGGEEEEYE